MIKKLAIFVRFGQVLTLNVYLDGVWMFVESFLLSIKVNNLERRTKYLAIAVYCVLLIIESLRLALGHFAATYRKKTIKRMGLSSEASGTIPELSGFVMVSVLMQLPLLSFFLFNQNLLNYPLEITLHLFVLAMTLAEIALCIFALKFTSIQAKYMYLEQSRQRQQEALEQQL